MKVSRDQNADYSRIAEIVRKDERLTYRTRGLYAGLLYLSESWRGGIADLAALGRQGTASVSADLRELERYGYVIRRTYKNENNKWEYELHLPACPVTADE